MEKVAIVTGAYGKIGKAIAEKIANTHDFKVVLVGRNEQKLIKSVGEIKSKTDNGNISYKIVDLSRKKCIQDFASNWNGPLNILINNASVTPRNRYETRESIEMQFATNVLGYYWMIKYFNKFMIDQEHARIVNVASYWAGGLDINDIEFKNRKYNNDIAYRQSKQADRMLSNAFSNMLKESEISVNACHPGDVNSKLSNNLGYGGHESPEEGASTPAWLALTDEVKNVTGKYFEHRKEVKCGFSEHKDEIEKLIELCRKY